MMKSIVTGIDIGGTHTVIGLVTREGECLAETSFSTQEDVLFEDFIERICNQIRGLLSKLPPNTYHHIGVGVGAPNGSFVSGEIENAVNLRWKGRLPICTEIEKRMHVPVALSNDANVAALGEMTFGAAKGIKNFVYITLGTGLGSGIVVDGKLVQGQYGFAGELGHISVKPWGRQCGCGKQGCLETYVSAPGIRRTAFKLLSESLEPSAIRSYTYESLTAKKLATLALQGDSIAREAFEITGAILGAKLADVIAILEPEVIFLFGGLSNAGSLIFEPTKRHIEKNLIACFKNKVKLLPSGLTDKNVAVLGAATQIWQNWVE